MLSKKNYYNKFFVIFVLGIIVVTFSACENPFYSDNGDYVLEINREGEGTVDPETGKHSYSSDDITPVSLEVEPDEGWYFYRWEGNVVEPYLKESKIFVDRNRSVRAVFDQFTTGFYSYDLNYNFDGITLPGVDEKDDVFTIVFSRGDYPLHYSMRELSANIEGEINNNQETYIDKNINKTVNIEDEQYDTWVSGTPEVNRDDEEQIKKIKETRNMTDDFEHFKSQEEESEFVVGDSDEFYLFYDEEGNDKRHEKEAELLLSEDEIMIWAVKDWIEDENIDIEDLRKAVNSLKDEFKDYRVDIKEYFGREPSADYYPVLTSRPEINILLAPFGSRLGGYFFSGDLIESSSSNERKILYVNSKYYNVEEQKFSESTHGIIAHEYQHLLFLNEKVLSGRPPEVDDIWINEGFSELAMDIAGYGYMKGFRDNTVKNYVKNSASTSLVFWNEGDDYEAELEDYGISYLFARYLYDCYGKDIIQAVSTSEKIPQKALAEATDISFDKLFADWAKAFLAAIMGYQDFENGYGEDGPEFSEEWLEDLALQLEPGKGYSENVIPWGVSFAEIVVSENNGDENNLVIDVEDTVDEGDFMKNVLRWKGE